MKTRTTHRLEWADRNEVEIQGLTNEAQGCNIAWVGRDGVTKIALTMERGEMSIVPWFAVYKGDRLAAMHPAVQVGGVHYREPTDED